MNQVKAEILKSADQYDFYSDLSGYSFDAHPTGLGSLFQLELQLNDNKGVANAAKDPNNGRPRVSFYFAHRQGLDLLIFHDGGFPGGISTSNRRRLEALIDQLIANCSSQPTAQAAQPPAQAPVQPTASASQARSRISAAKEAAKTVWERMGPAWTSDSKWQKYYFQTLDKNNEAEIKAMTKYLFHRMPAKYRNDPDWQRWASKAFDAYGSD
jgi:hypothetical protein